MKNWPKSKDYHIALVGYLRRVYCLVGLAMVFILMDQGKVAAAFIVALLVCGFALHCLSHTSGDDNRRQQSVNELEGLSIRDVANDRVSIRFAKNPESTKIASSDGRELYMAWNPYSLEATVNRVPVLVVSDGQNRVEIRRVVKSIYDFATENAAQLLLVFDSDGATYFKFGPTAVHISVTDSDGQSNGAVVTSPPWDGEENATYYCYAGTADKFIVSGDGTTTMVIRRDVDQGYQISDSKVDPFRSTQL
jgi:hypothetical protein